VTAARDDRALSVFIAIPSRDMVSSGINGRLAMLLVDLARRPDAPAIEIVPGYPVDRVRNQICKRFLESDAEYLLMIDDDTVPPPTPSWPGRTPQLGDVSSWSSPASAASRSRRKT
jgi:hypothetical protein